MKTPTGAPYNNEVTADYLLAFDQPSAKEQELAALDAEDLALARQRQAYREAHPPIGIYRLATEGSQTRDGGAIQKGTSPLEVTLEDGQRVNVAQVGDYVMYADGRKAQIITGAGEGSSNIALVGSRLGNGDQVINTPYGDAVLLARKGVAMDPDFLPGIEV